MTQNTMHFTDNHNPDKRALIHLNSIKETLS